MTTKTPRPRLTDQSVLEATVQKLLPEVLSWAGDEDHQNFADDLRDVIKHNYELDGYVLAKSLEDSCYWSPDATLVEILDKAMTMQFRAHRQATADWVRAEGIVLAHQVGDTVEVPHPSATGWVTGTITHADPVHAQYAVHCPGLGHVDAGKLGTQGTIVDAEEIKQT